MIIEAKVLVGWILKGGALPFFLFPGAGGGGALPRLFEEDHPQPQNLLNTSLPSSLAFALIYKSAANFFPPIYPVFLFACFLAITARADVASPSPASASASDVTVERLRCEYLVDPLGLDVPQPRLDWILTGKKDGARNLGQTSYRILVASSPAPLVHDRGDLWDSGDVQSSETAHVAYGGSSLRSRQPCFWKVRITDSLGRVSAWSAIASWEMGLIRFEDWQAKWIEAPTISHVEEAIAGTVAISNASYEALDGAGSRDVTALVAGKLTNNTLAMPVNNDALGGDPANPHLKQLRVTYTVDGQEHQTTAPEGYVLTIPETRWSFPYLRKDFTLTKSVAKARIYVTALGLYELHLNGRRVGDHLFAPDWTDYTKRVRYQAYDVTSMIRPGENTLGALVGNGWYSGHIGNGGFQCWGKVPALFAQLEVTYTDGSVDRVITDASWKKHPSPIIDSDFMLGEDYDARQEITGWDRPGLEVSDWIPVTERTEAARSLDGQVDQPVREIGELHPKSLRESQPGHWVYDLGQNMVGFVRLKISAPAGTKITLRHAEMLNPDRTIYTTNLRRAPSVDTYICKGSGMETWQPRFTFHGFRYVELTGLPQPPDESTVTGIVIGTDIPRHGKFACSNADLNQLQSNIQWGMRGNYLSVPTDCPQRDERLGWMGDAQVFIRTAAYNGDVAAFFTKWLVDVDDTQKPDGAFTDFSPRPPGIGSGTPGWADAGVICPWTIYLMYGDKRILEKNLPAMKRWIDWCQLHSTNEIRDHDRGPDYGDWLSQGETTAHDLIGTAYFAYSTSLVAKACQITGDTDAEKYSQLFEQIKTAFNQHYVSPDGHIEGGTQCAYGMALRFHLLADNLRPKAAQYLADNVRAHQDHLTTGFIGVSYLLPALTSEGQTETAYRLLLQDTFPSWLFSVKNGATTVWERWDGWTPERGFQDPEMNSFNHYSLGSCGEWMFDTVAGIGVDPDEPGFSHVIIHPQPGGSLTHAEGLVDSIHGPISSKWRRLQDGTFSLQVSIPVNTAATVYLPTANPDAVSEGKHALAGAPGIRSAKTEGSAVKVEIGSGDYRFNVRL